MYPNCLKGITLLIKLTTGLYVCYHVVLKLKAVHDQVGHSLTWAQKRILLSQIFKVVESNFDQGCLTELTFIFLNIYTAVVDT